MPKNTKQQRLDSILNSLTVAVVSFKALLLPIAAASHTELGAKIRLINLMGRDLVCYFTNASSMQVKNIYVYFYFAMKTTG